MNKSRRGKKILCVIAIIAMFIIPVSSTAENREIIESTGRTGGVRIIFLCEIDITDTSEKGRVSSIPPLLLWSANGDITVEGPANLISYSSTELSGGFFIFFRGDFTENPVSIKGRALIAVIYPL